MSNLSAKETANVKSISKNDSAIQDESQKCEKFTDFLFNIRKHHSNKIIMAHININSLRNKFGILTNSASGYIDILMISETKLDDTFPHVLFHLKDFSSLHRLDRNSLGQILVYVKDNIPSHLVKLEKSLKTLKVSLLN